MCPISLSPSVTVNEIDLTGIVPQVSSTEAATAGVFRWGPVQKRVLVDSENTLIDNFYKPSNFNAETWYAAANFLAYGNALYVSRAANTSGVIIASNGMSFSATPILSCTTTSGNATLVVANTAGLAVGMIVAAGGANVVNGSTISSITNSTAIVVSSNSAIVGTGTSSVQFISNTIVLSAIANVGSVSNLANQIVLNEENYALKDTTDLNNVSNNRSFDTNVIWVARWPGRIGSSLRVSTCDTAVGYTGDINLASYGNGGATISLNVGSNSATVSVIYRHDGSSNTTAQTTVATSTTNLSGVLNVTDYLQFGNTTAGFQSLQVNTISAVTSNVNGSVAAATFTIGLSDQLRLVESQTANTVITRYWEFFSLVDSAPGQSDFVANFGNTAANDELHVVVVDDDGLFTGTAGEVLEVYKNVSRATNGKTIDGQTNYYKNVINSKSKYVWWANDRSTAPSANATVVTSASNNKILSLPLNYGTNGSDESTISAGVLQQAWDMFKSPEEVDISLLVAGKARGGVNGELIANYLIDNIAEVRKDCVAMISPDYYNTVNAVGNERQNLITFRNSLRSTSYGMMDSSHKYQYDRYNDLYRYVPSCGDITGLAVRTDSTNDPWWAFAGYNRGQIKNVVKLAYNPKLGDRDQLYKNNINPLVTQNGEGTLLLGDKTLLSKPSAFDRINVRRLFIVLEKSISKAAKYSLFEFNDDFTRAQFRNLVTPYLRGIKGKRGITDFLVVCDSTNNTPEIIDSNQFVADIYIKPARSINFIQLNFIAVPTGVTFAEVVGIW